MEREAPIERIKASLIDSFRLISFIREATDASFAGLRNPFEIPICSSSEIPFWVEHRGREFTKSRKCVLIQGLHDFGPTIVFPVHKRTLLGADFAGYDIVDIQFDPNEALDWVQVANLDGVSRICLDKWRRLNEPFLTLIRSQGSKAFNAAEPEGSVL